METEHKFTLVLDGISELTPEVMNALFEAGCDDATVSGQNGRIAMDFDRAGISMREAIVSAIHDVRKAGIGARVVRVEEARSEPGTTEAGLDVGAINSVLHLSIAMETDPTLRPLVVNRLDHVR